MGASGPRHVCDTVKISLQNHSFTMNNDTSTEILQSLALARNASHMLSQPPLEGGR